MKNTYNFWIVLLLFAVGNLFVACSSSDDEEEEEEMGETGGITKPSIIGTWKYYFSSGYILLNLGENGIGYTQEFDWEDGGLYERDYISYSYDKEKKQYVIFESEEGDTDSIPVVRFDKETLVIKDVDEEEDDNDGELHFTRVTEADSLIVGSWVNYYGDDPLYEYSAYVFFEDGTGLNFDKGNGATSLMYMYNPQKKVLTIIEDGDVSSEVVLVTANTLKRYDDYGDEKTYNKQSSFLTHDKLILGKWLLTITDGPNKYYQSEVCFYADGTYKADDYTKTPKNFIGSFTGTYSITNNTLSIKGQSQIAGDYTIEGLVVNGTRFLKDGYEYPYLIGGWKDR